MAEINNKTTKQQKEKMRVMYQSGESIASISRKLGLTYNTTKYWAKKELGYKTNN